MGQEQQPRRAVAGKGQMMDVTIYYTSGYKKAPGAVERTTTPLESGFDKWRACFRESSENPGTWWLALEHYERGANGKGAAWVTRDMLIAKKCGDQADYLEWLASNVELVEVDGRPFWTNPGIEEA